MTKNKPSCPVPKSVAEKIDALELAFERLDESAYEDAPDFSRQLEDQVERPFYKLLQTIRKLAVAPMGDRTVQ